MCLAFWTLAHPRYALILASNRDEFLSRPTIPAAWHNFDLPDRERDVLSGRDAMAGGTWLGVNRQGDVALLTNITEQIAQYPTSRGDLASHFLTSPPSAADRLETYTSQLETEQRPYAGFNLLLISPSSTKPQNYRGVLVTNSHGGGQISSRALSGPECLACGLSNASDGAREEWPKVEQGRKLFSEVVEKEMGEDELVEALCGVMSVENPTPPTTRYGLRTTISVPPIPVEPTVWANSLNSSSKEPPSDSAPEGNASSTLPASADAAPALSEPLPQKDYYGTRLTSIVLITREGRVTFVERDVWTQELEGEEPVKRLGERRFTFDITSQRENVE